MHYLLRCFFSAFVLLLFAGSNAVVYAYQLRGTITNKENEPLAYVSVYVENTTYGTASNLKGNYSLELEPGTHNIVFQSMGFEKKNLEVTIRNSNVECNVMLHLSQVALQEINVTAQRRDPAYEIIKHARKARKKYLNQLETYRCNTYIKAILDKAYIQKGDTVPDSLQNTLTREQMNLVESWSETHFRRPGTYKEIKLAYRDFSDKQAPPQVGLTIDIDREEDGPPVKEEINPWLFFLNVSDAEFNFYRSTMDLHRLSEKPFISPIGASALMAYQFRLEEMFYENDTLTYKIEVIPRLTEGALFKGYIYIRDKVWAIKSIDLALNCGVMNFFRTFHIKQDYSLVQDSIWVVSRRELFYTAKNGKKTMIGHTFVQHSEYELNPHFDKTFFNHELYGIEEDAYEKGTIYWDSIRPVTLKQEEQSFIHLQDSISRYKKSEGYLLKQDSIYNKKGFWEVALNGMQHRNRAKGYDWFLYPLIATVRPFGVGGYRQTIGGDVTKEWSKAKALQLEKEISYGFLNKDVKGEAKISYLYQPKRFGEAFVGAGDVYEMVNTFESATAFFSRSNYVRKTHFSLGHRMEYRNGVYVKSGLEFSDRRSIHNIQLAQWSQDLFGELNQPVVFDRYRVFLLDVKVNLTLRQKYYMKPYRKVIVGSDLPVLSMHYKKGISGIMGSEVDFDFLEVNARHAFKPGTLGTSKWNVYAGRFLREKDLRFLEHKFFRGSDRGWFSNPLKSMQLLKASGIDTKKAYFQGHYIHHFNGALMNKIPFVNTLRLQTVAGAGALFMEENGFRHLETFAGIERPFRIKKQRFKMGVYLVGSDSNVSQADASFKIGIDFFNPISNSWTY